MPSASDVCGSFWGTAILSEFADAYVSASRACLEHATKYSPGFIRGWTLLSTDLTLGSANGRPTYGYPLPLNIPTIVAADLVGGRVLIRDIDFSISNNTIWFNDDPLLSWATVKRFQWVSGSPVSAADLIYVATDDAVEPNTESTYESLINAIVTSCDSPASVGGETVTDVWADADGTYRVITDKSAYLLPSSDTPSVAVGAALKKGQPIGSAWILTKLGPALPDLSYLTVPADYHQGVTSGGVTWYNGTRNLVVDTVSSRTRVRWPLGASGGDFTAFWTESHTTGIAGSVKSLAQAMDVRANPVGDPDATSLPTTVNPLQFVCQELFQGNAYLLIVNSAKLGPKATSTADRQAATAKAVGPYATVFDYTDTMPSIPEITPT